MSTGTSGTLLEALALEAPLLTPLADAPGLTLLEAPGPVVPDTKALGTPDVLNPELLLALGAPTEEALVTLEPAVPLLTTAELTRLAALAGGFALGTPAPEVLAPGTLPPGTLAVLWTAELTPVFPLLAVPTAPTALARTSSPVPPGLPQAAKMAATRLAGKAGRERTKCLGLFTILGVCPSCGSALGPQQSRVALIRRRGRLPVLKEVPRGPQRERAGGGGLGRGKSRSSSYD